MCISFILRIPLNIGEAEKARDSLARGLYDKLFRQITEHVNNHLSPNASNNISIGILDIAGFGKLSI